MQEYISKLDKLLDEYLGKKAPGLPKNIVEFIVKISPWAALIFGLLAIPALLGAFGVGLVATPYVWWAGHRTLWYWVWWAFTAVQVGLELMAVKPLMDRKKKGWQLLFYSSLVMVVSNLLNLSVGSLVGILIGWYALYQVKPSYK